MQIHVNDQISLTGFLPEDGAELVNYLNDPLVYANTLRIPHPYTDKDAAEWLEFTGKLDQDAGFRVNWVIRHMNSGRMIGSIGRLLNYGKDAHLDEIGYWLGSPFRGQGLMTQAVVAFSDYLFDELKLERLTANVFSHNPASVRVLEKAGFLREGYMRHHYLKDGKFLDGILMAKLRGDRP